MEVVVDEVPWPTAWSRCERILQRRTHAHLPLTLTVIPGAMANGMINNVNGRELKAWEKQREGQERRAGNVATSYAQVGDWQLHDLRRS